MDENTCLPRSETPLPCAQVNALAAVSTSVPPARSDPLQCSHTSPGSSLFPLIAVPFGWAAGWLAAHPFVPACLPPGHRSRCESPGRNMFPGLDERVGFCLSGCRPEMQIHPLPRSARERESVLLLHEQISGLLTYILLLPVSSPTLIVPHLTFLVIK